MKLTILFTAILLTISISAQEALMRFPSYNGKVEFSFGETPVIPSNRLAIRIDTLLLRFFPQPEVHFTMHTTVNYYSDYDLSIDLVDPAATDPAGTRSNRTDISHLNIDTNYRNKNVTGNRLFALGNIKLSGIQASKVEWLDIDFAHGRVMELEKYRRLRGINTCRSSLQSSWRATHYGYTGDLYPIKLEGDPFFWDDLQKCPKLEALSLRQDNGEFLFLDEELGKVLATHRMKSLYLDGLPYLPVNFKDFESANYLSVGQVYLPEAINMAIVMNSFGKDTSGGKWSDYLTVAREKSVPFPENGWFETHYINNQFICRGAFKNGMPDGKWEFYYENGQLCEQRFYESGQKTGNWTFFEPGGDTSAFFRYENGKLVYREDRRKDYDNPCDNYEFSYNVIRQTIYQLDWKNNAEIYISKQQISVVPIDSRDDRSPKGDTLSNINETWHFTQNEWEHSWVYDCKAERYDRYRKGNIGQNTYYGRNVEKYTSIRGISPNTYQYIQIRETMDDLPNNIHEEDEFNNENPEKVMKHVYSIHIPLMK